MPLDPFTFILATLATFRLSLLFTKEQGPDKVFEKIRKAPKPGSGVREWLSCIFCFSMTSAAVVATLLYFSGVREPVAIWFLIWCALSAGTVLLNQTFTKGKL